MTVLQLKLGQAAEGLAKARMFFVVANMGVDRHNRANAIDAFSAYRNPKILSATAQGLRFANTAGGTLPVQRSIGLTTKTQSSQRSVRRPVFVISVPLW